MTKESAIRILRGDVLGTNEQTHEAVFMAIRALKAEAEPVKHGRWWHYEGTLTCSVCHTEIYDDVMELLGDNVPRYCPNCGAKMDASNNAHWIKQLNGEYKCSVCGDTTLAPLYECGTCGTKMGGVENE